MKRRLLLYAGLLLALGVLLLVLAGAYAQAEAARFVDDAIRDDPGRLRRFCVSQDYLVYVYDGDEWKAYRAGLRAWATNWDQALMGMPAESVYREFVARCPPSAPGPPAVQVEIYVATMLMQDPDLIAKICGAWEERVALFDGDQEAAYELSLETFIFDWEALGYKEDDQLVTAVFNEMLARCPALYDGEEE
ncbi:MAG: hypothetical protein ACRD02_13175 [Acidimicrobiia bacterium]